MKNTTTITMKKGGFFPATDGATNYKREMIDALDDETFDKWLDFHFTICERGDLIGASHHTLDILQKEEI